MRAVVVHGPRDLRVEERPDPVPGPGEVAIAVEWGGICGSDLAYFKHGASGTAKLTSPLVLGHEIAGRIARVGTGVSGIEVGQPVTVHPAQLVGDGVMDPRLEGRTNLYPRVRYFGSAAFDPHTDGGFAGVTLARAEQLRALPESVDTLRGALAEPLAVAMHAVRRAGSLAGKDILVNGAGPIGALVIAAARHAGAQSITAADISDASLARAKAMGADATVNVSAAALPDDVEVVFEATGLPAVLGAVLRATARGGTLLQVGNLPGTPAPSVLGDLVTREITWIGSYRFIDEISDAVRVMAEGLDVGPVISHRFEAEDALAAMELAADPAAESGKVMLHFGGPHSPAPDTAASA
ncbi:L-idonate 5-dehydrogenase [Sinomonas mesophila]|uniref:L-idonate 5-dehydrogenase n=1 Tax=Sinomonas mesophila TaxID=1531955 RepID=UPI000984DC9E|nr:L-idonate 5-dehydrogenase [Sinomonas mesophila]